MPKVRILQSAFPEACFCGLSDVLECSGGFKMALVTFAKKPPDWKRPPWERLAHHVSY